MNPAAAQDILRRTVPAGLPVLLVGAPGVGKTAIVQALAEELDYRLVVSHPVTADPTDFRGLPWMVDGHACFLPIGDLARLSELDGQRGIWLIDDLGHIMLKVTGYVMLFAPIAVWAAITATVAKNGLLVLWKLVVFMGGFYLSLMLLWGILVMVGFIVIGPRYSHLLRLIREPLMIAFSTASSEAAYPKTLEGLNRFGASSRISSFVLPLGYSFNLDGTMMYCTFASIFIAQTYKIEMSLATQLAMLATLMITSKGVAGVPRASLVVIASTLSQFGIPEAGLLMIMGIDTFLDMGRSATNVIGNSLATAVVAKWEGELAPEHALGPDDVVPPDMIPGEIPAMAGH